MASYQSAQVQVPAGMIDFGVGQPGLSLLPLAVMRQAAAHRLGQPDPTLLQYGAEQGDGRFRLALAEFLSEGYGIAVEAEQLLITNGVSQGLDWVCHRFTRPGDTIFVEEPTYHLVLPIFLDRGLKVVAVPTDENGLIVEALEEKLAEQRPAFLYTIPVFHNPSTVTLAADRRRRLAALSRRHGFLIAADEVYQLLNYAATPPPPLISYDEAGQVLSLGSFSKILGPGLRLGWIQAAPGLIERLVDSGLLHSGGGFDPFTSGLVHSAIELGLQQSYLAHLKSVYSQRVRVLSDALRRHLPPSVTFHEPQGGFFIWLRLPPDVDAGGLLAEARRQGVGFQPGARFSVNGGLRNYLRLSFAYYDAPELQEGARRLAQVIRREIGGAL
ncbi:MAG: PLP-dependent aminotransferase family protein [Anaerolineae bacterium]